MPSYVSPPGHLNQTGSDVICFDSVPFGQRRPRAQSTANKPPQNGPDVRLEGRKVGESLGSSGCFFTRGQIFVISVSMHLSRVIWRVTVLLEVKSTSRATG